jgi:hypothetical protein
VLALKDDDIGVSGTCWQFLVNRAGKPIKRYPPAMDGGVYEHIEKDLSGMLTV